MINKTENNNRLDGIQAIRRRPGMYIGNTDERGAYCTIVWALQTIINQQNDIQPTKVTVTVHQDGTILLTENQGLFKVIDGQIPKPFYRKELESHWNPKWPIFATLALSQWMVIDIWQESVHYQFRFEAGYLVETTKETNTSHQQGSHIHFLLDATIFDLPANFFPYHRMVSRLRNLATCYPTLKIELYSEPDDLFCQLQYNNGVQDYLIEHLEAMIFENHHCPKPLLLNKKDGTEQVSIALTWTNSETVPPQIVTILNGERNYIPGTHTQGLQAGLFKVINHKFSETAWAEDGYVVTKQSVLHGLVCVLNLQTELWRFAGANSFKLYNPEAYQQVEQTILEQLPHYLEQDTELFDRVAYLARVPTSGIDGSNILIIDDNPTSLPIIDDYLEEHGANIWRVRNGQSGIEYAQQYQPALILLDVLMPEMDGFETYECLKMDNRTKNIPVIFMIDLADNASRHNVFEVGGFDYIMRPVDFTELMIKVKRALTFEMPYN